MEFEKIRDIIAETLGCDVEKVTPEATIAGDLEADSLAAVEILMALEDATGVSIDDSEASNFKTVGDILTYLENNAG